MANLEETQESELDSILTELSMLEQKGDLRQSRVQTHSRSSSIVSSGVNSTISTSTTATITSTERTDSPDNDSAFSDTVSLLSSESSASSGLSSLHNNNNINISKNIIIPSSQNNLVQVSISLFYWQQFQNFYIL
jgi:amyloid beta A4 precursor protein-binding family B protein 1-interacting protein